MASWIPAGEVKELVDADGSGKGTDAKKKRSQGRSTGPRGRGRIRSKTLQPQNPQHPAGMIVSSTAAPKLPQVPDFSKPDGAWKEGAAAYDEEQTVTVLRGEEAEEGSGRLSGDKRKPQRKRLLDRNRASTRPPPPPRGGPRKPLGGVTSVVLQTSPRAEDGEAPAKGGSSDAPQPASAKRARDGAGHKVRIDPAMAALAARATVDARLASTPPPAPFFDDEEATMIEQVVGTREAQPLTGVRPAEATRPFPEMADQRIQPHADIERQHEAYPSFPPAPALPRDMVHATRPPPRPATPSLGIEKFFRNVAGLDAKQARWVTFAGSALLLLTFAFAVGRCSVGSEGDVPEAKAKWASRTRLELPSLKQTQRPCLMSLAPARWAPRAAQSVPIELVATPGGKLAVGFGETALVPGGVLVDARSGEIGERAKLDEQPSPLERVVPLPSSKELRYAPSTRTSEILVRAVHVAQAPSFLIGFGKDAVMRSDAAGETPVPLWPLESEKRADAMRLRSVEDGGVVVVYRHEQRIWYGLLDEDSKVSLKAQAVEGTAGKVGKPTAAVNRGRLVVAFAQKADAQSPIEILWAKGKYGEELGPAERIAIPAGGPKGNAMAPALAALSGGRWLLGWTEGCPKACTMRVQTYDQAFKPLGNALRVSPATGRFGQGVVGVVGETAAVGFLLDTGGSYELWGTVLQCL